MHYRTVKNKAISNSQKRWFFNCFWSSIYGQRTSEGFILVLQRLPEQIKEKNEKMKEEMIGN